MRKKYVLLCITILSIIALAACGNSEDNETTKETDSNESHSDKIQAVTSFTIIEDMVKEIGGDLVEVYNLVPTGTDPHEYDPLPDDIKAATDADILFYNGLNLERSEEHTSELQSRGHLVCRLLLEKKKTDHEYHNSHADDIELSA